MVWLPWYDGCSTGNGNNGDKPQKEGSMSTTAQQEQAMAANKAKNEAAKQEAKAAIAATVAQVVAKSAVAGTATATKTPAPKKAIKKPTPETTGDTKKKASAPVRPVKVAKVTGEATATKGNVIPQEFRERYGKLGNNGDSMAKKLAKYTEKAGEDKELVRELLMDLAKANEIDGQAKWGHLNNGMVRMNLGNVLRAKASNGKEIKGLD